LEGEFRKRGNGRKKGSCAKEKRGGKGAKKNSRSPALGRKPGITYREKSKRIQAEAHQKPEGDFSERREASFALAKISSITPPKTRAAKKGKVKGKEPPKVA